LEGKKMDLPAGILTLQRTDRWVGVPLCAILTLLRRIFECARRPGPHQVRRILFVKFAEQGSTVLAYPAIRRAIDMVGRENVYFVVFEDNRFILDAMDVIPEGNVITIARTAFSGSRLVRCDQCIESEKSASTRSLIWNSSRASPQC
jgi:hypothetical protein